MGFGKVKVALERLGGGAPHAEVELLVDTGALYSMVPTSLLHQIGVEPIERLDFQMANGQVFHRDVGEARFFYNGRQGVSKVIFGEREDASLMGVVTLESLGLEVDPIGKGLRPARLIMYASRISLV